MSIPANDQAKLDIAQNKINGILTSLQARQETYKTNFGKYAQQWPKKEAGTLYRIDEYVGPNGVGYILTFYAFVNGKVYYKQYHTGPETDRQIDTEWVEEV